MLIRTPRRRISPRTRQRVRTIRNFLRSALGTTSARNSIKISSSIAVNVTDLKQKIHGIEQQLTAVSKHCRDLTCIEHSARESADRTPKLNEADQFSGTNNKKTSKTQVIYNAKTHRRKSNDTLCQDIDYRPKNNNYTTATSIRVKSDNLHARSRHRKSRDKISIKRNAMSEHSTDFHRLRGKVYDSHVSDQATTSYHSLRAPCTRLRNHDEYRSHYRDRHTSRQQEHYETSPNRAKEKRSRRQNAASPKRHQENTHPVKKTKNINNLDQDFIKDLIQRQYRPVKLFGARHSDFSQITAPVCKDQEFSLRESILEDPDLCSCGHSGRYRSNYVCNNDVSDMRSICDTRLYSKKKRKRPKIYRQPSAVYKGAEDYDLIPVKEKSSPKSRRKFVEENKLPPYSYYKEVPPSPRTQRPRLNLRAQYYDEYGNTETIVKPRRRKVSPRRLISTRVCDSNSTSEIFNQNHFRDNQKPENFMSTTANIDNEFNANNENTLNKSEEINTNSDKTDKALNEIKDILQTFLNEIKKDASTGSNTNNISESNSNQVKNKQEAVKTNSEEANNMQQSFPTNFNNFPCSGQCNMSPNFMNSFTNPCCCRPVIPICPVNCIPNGYIVPNPSYTCLSCMNIPSEKCQNNSSNTDNGTTVNKEIKNETEELIREIYKFVAQNKESEATNKFQEKVLTSRSVGAYSRHSKRDAQVGTPKLKYYSKSCEAIASRPKLERKPNTTASYSDTVIDRLSLEVSQSLTDTDVTSESTVEKKKTNRLAKALHTIGLFKKKKKEALESLSPSESTTQQDMRRRSPLRSRSPPPPFRQEITNYMMHGQEYYHQPPYPPYHQSYPRAKPPPHCSCGRGEPHGYESKKPEHYKSINEIYNPHTVHNQTIYEHERFLPSAPPYPAYDPHLPPCHSHCPPNLQPVHSHSQVPLCLKEIEVKSMSTQSEKKMGFFNKLRMKVKPPAQNTPYYDNDYGRQNCSTQTQTKLPPRPQETQKSSLFQSWKNLQNEMKMKQQMKLQKRYPQPEIDPMRYEFETHKRLANGDIKMRNAMLKRMFYKRNPFSPRNLVIKTLLGKDKSSYGEPMSVYRPKMFY